MYIHEESVKGEQLVYMLAYSGRACTTVVEPRSGVHVKTSNVALLTFSFLQECFGLYLAPMDS
jgi:hypothetical protein